MDEPFPMETAPAPKGIPTVAELCQLIEDLKHEESEARLAATKELNTIATALGPERVRTELLPYIADSVDDEDEVLEELCEQLANFIPLVGGETHAYHILPVYEAIASGEEAVLRVKAIAGLTALVARLPPAHIGTHVLAVVRRLVRADAWRTQKASGCGLIHVIFSSVDATAQVELLRYVQALSEDPAVMVRRAVAENMKHLVPVVGLPALTQLLHPIFVKLTADDQDSVRMLAVALCVPISRAVEPVSLGAAVMPYLTAGVKDSAWRVRYVVATNFTDLQDAVGPAVTKEVLLPAFVQLLGDSEAEVRTAVSLNVLKFCRALDADIQIEALLTGIIPQLRLRVADDAQQVRAAVASVIMGLSSVLGKANTIQFLLPLFLQLLKDEFSEVSLNIISNLDEVNKVIGIGQLTQALQPAINELAQHDTWRVRKAIIERIPLVSKQLGHEFFDKELVELCMTWLQDKVFCVRQAAVENVKCVIEIFGIEWAKGSILARVLKMAQDSKAYSARLVSIFTIDSLVDICPKDVIAMFLIPVLCSLFTDKIANIRFNVCKTLGKMMPAIDSGIYGAQVKDVLDRMTKDGDVDVRYYAQKAIHTANSLGYA